MSQPILLPKDQARALQIRQAENARVFQLHSATAMQVMAKLTDVHCSPDDLELRAKRAIQAADALLAEYGMALVINKGEGDE